MFPSSCTCCFSSQTCLSVSLCCLCCLLSLIRDDWGTWVLSRLLGEHTDDDEMWHTDTPGEVWLMLAWLWLTGLFWWNNLWDTWLESSSPSGILGVVLVPPPPVYLLVSGVAVTPVNQSEISIFRENQLGIYKVGLSQTEISIVSTNQR